MPHRQVYGKRSRAVYDPFAVLASPQHALASVDISASYNNAGGSDRETLESKDVDTNKVQGAHREALSDIDVNTVQRPLSVVDLVAKQNGRWQRDGHSPQHSKHEQKLTRSKTTIEEPEMEQSAPARRGRRQQSCSEAAPDRLRENDDGLATNDETARSRQKVEDEGRFSRKDVSKGSRESRRRAGSSHTEHKPSILDGSAELPTSPEHIALADTLQTGESVQLFEEDGMQSCRDDGRSFILGNQSADEHRRSFYESAGRQRAQKFPRETPKIAILPPTPPLLSELEHATADLLSLSTHALSAYQEWAEQIGQHFHVTKIAEASFGEVYRLSLRQRIPSFSKSDESVFKIIALKPPPGSLPKDKRKRNALARKAEAMSSPEDVASELKLLQRMVSTPGFTNFRDVRVLYGRPPQVFIDAYNVYNVEQLRRKKDPSIFPDPAKKSSYNEHQLWAVIEMQDAGTDLERVVEDGCCSSIWAVWDVFWQVALTLGKGEEEAEFEHRDLHLGNICVRDKRTGRPSEVKGAIAIDTTRKLGFTDLETTIIDYTISRCNLPSQGVGGGMAALGLPCALYARSSASLDNSIAYTDLDLPAHSFLFTGDSTLEYQYDIYRYMRSALHLSSPTANFTSPSSTQRRASRPRSWKDFCPVSNLIWLHFVLYKLLEQVDWPSAEKRPNRRTRKDEYKAWKKATELEHILLQVQGLLEPAKICGNALNSVSDLVALALCEGWLDVSDVIGANLDGKEDVTELTLEECLAKDLADLRVEGAKVPEYFVTEV